MNSQERGIEINLLQLVKKLLENAKYVVLVTVIFGILGYVGSMALTIPTYQASARMIVNSRKDQTSNITNDQLNSARNLVETYAVILRGRDVLGQVIKELELQESYEQLLSAITVKSVNETPVMQITVEHVNRDTALQIAAKILEIAPAILVETTEAGSVKAVEQAYASTDPMPTGVMKKTVLMAFVGFAIACLVIFVLMLLDNTYKTEEDVQRNLGLPVLGVIPEVDSCRGGRSARKK